MNFDPISQCQRPERHWKAPCFISSIALLALCLSAVTSRGAAYYVSASGQDTNSGTSPALAWKTIAHANNQLLKPGDQLLFQGGSTFSGTIYFGPAAAGTEANPMLVSSYGIERATINGGNTNGFFAYNCAGINVSNLNFVGSGRAANRNSGIEFYNDGGGAGRQLNFVRVNEVDVSGFGYVGIIVGGSNGTNAYSDVRVVNADAHDNAN